MEFVDSLTRQYTKPKGSLIIIGGHEDREGDRLILNEVARRATARREGKKTRAGTQSKQLVITAVASNIPEQVLPDYEQLFTTLGVDDIGRMEIRTPEDARNEENVRMVRDAAVLFFTGGDQLRITSQIGVSPLFEAMHELYLTGGTIVGTSAGAAAMSEIMVISGEGDQSNELGAVAMGAGLGLLREVVIDSHFAQRGRLGRLLGAVSQNPRSLGVGIDEDTAIIVEQAESFRVIGSGAVYVVEGRFISYSTWSERRAQGVLSMFDTYLHILGAGGSFSLASRRPVISEDSDPSSP